MPERQLTEAAWKTFAKGKGLKDGPWLQALSALEKAERSGPQAELEALGQVEKQADLLVKANKGNKEIAGWFGEVDKALDKQRKLAEKAAKEAARKEEESAESEDDEDSPALLTSKMIPLLREVKKGLPMKALVAFGGKDCAVLVSRRPSSPARRKLLAEYLKVAGGLKYAAGDCIFEENAVTFVLESSPGGMAKKLKAALFEQTGQRLKVRVRGQDRNDVDIEEEGEVQAEDGAAPGTAQTAAPDPAVRIEIALEGWRSARGAAVSKLKALAKEVADAKLPESMPALIEVNAVLKNLTAEPRTAQQVSELMRWVNEDDVVLDVSEIAEDIRTPLIGALEAIRRALGPDA